MDAIDSPHPIPPPGDRDVRVVTVHGELDVASAPKLRAALARRPTGQPVVISLSDVSFMDGAGIDVLVEAVERGEREGFSVAIADAPPGVLRLLDITGLGARLPRAEHALS